MKTIAFNTGRAYTALGQIIVATLHDDGIVTFMDHSRKVDGMVPLGSRHFDRLTVQNLYDGGTCSNDIRSFQDGMSRGGANASHLLTDEVLAKLKDTTATAVLLDEGYLPADKLGDLTLDQLTHQYVTFCAAHGLSDEGSADELLVELMFLPFEARSHEQNRRIAWVSDFIKAWEAVEVRGEADGKAYEAAKVAEMFPLKATPFVFGVTPLSVLLPEGYRSDLSLTEAQIIEAVLIAAIGAGFCISVEDEDGECAIERSTNLPLIRAEIGTTSQTNLYFYSIEMSNTPLAPAGWVYLVHGNEDCVISDYSTKLEEILKPANDFAEKLGG